MARMSSVEGQTVEKSRFNLDESARSIQGLTMPRELRGQYPGGIHHVMSRGDQRDDIFLDDVDRHDFIKTLAEVCQKIDWQAHGFCLMPNRYHLVLETPKRQSGFWHGLAAEHVYHPPQQPAQAHRSRPERPLQSPVGGGQRQRVFAHRLRLRPSQPGPRQAPGAGGSVAYPWSSFPLYLSAPDHRPRWLRTECLLGEHGIQRDTPAGRQEFERHLVPSARKA